MSSITTKDYPMTPANPPILYSFRRCPYAMRSRLALAAGGIRVEIREIELRNKPQDLLKLSPKGTVPVLALENGRVIDESLDIMYWALWQNDPLDWLEACVLQAGEALIKINDTEFKYQLDRYKYADRYPEHPQAYYRRQGEGFLSELENRLIQHRHLCGAGFTLADAAILPFVRQFAAVDSAWFQQAPYSEVRRWLNDFTASEPFAAIMANYPVWRAGDPPLLFPEE